MRADHMYRPQAAQRGCAGHHDHPGDDGGQPGCLQGDHARGDTDHVAEDNNAQRDPGERFRGGNGLSDACSGAALNELSISHSPIRPAAARQYTGQLVSSAIKGVRISDLHGAAGQRVRDPEDQPGCATGQRRPLLARAPRLAITNSHAATAMPAAVGQ